MVSLELIKIAGVLCDAEGYALPFAMVANPIPCLHICTGIMTVRWRSYRGRVVDRLRKTIKAASVEY